MTIGFLSFDSREPGILILNEVKDRKESGIKNRADVLSDPHHSERAERADSAR